MGEVQQKQMRIRRADVCAGCNATLPAGTLAEWDAIARVVTCLMCVDVRENRHLERTRADPRRRFGSASTQAERKQRSAAPQPPPEPRPEVPPAYGDDAKDHQPVTEGTPGASAEREHRRRLAKLEAEGELEHRRKGPFGKRRPVEPWQVRVWGQGSKGEVATAAKLTKRLQGSPVRLLHDRQVPRHRPANIDHITVGPGGVTVIDSKTHRGAVNLRREGTFDHDDSRKLIINGRNQTKLVDGVLKQVGWIREVLAGSCFEDTDIQGVIALTQRRYAQAAARDSLSAAMAVQHRQPFSPDRR